MKKNQIILQVALASLLLTPNAYSQPDSLSIAVEIGLKGRWQTGNLNQLAINPDASLVLSKAAFSSEVQASYQYLRVNGFVAISDFWTMGILRHRPNRTLFPMLATNYGFAKSYKIDHSFLIGPGVGINLYNNSPGDFLRVQVFAGYMNIKFESKDPHSTAAIGTISQSAFSISKRMNIAWDFQTYNPGLDAEYWGFNNRIIIHYMVIKNMSLNLGHTVIFNNKTVASIKKTNGLMLFGIQYIYKNP
ncbi:MAG: DUF481 domain-containing protein [Calditrichia bacterium]